MKKNIGTDFDEFLKEEGIFEEVENLAVKKVIALQIKKFMEDRKISKTHLAESMNTSRASLDRLLNQENFSVTLLTLQKAAKVLGKKLRVELV